MRFSASASQSSTVNKIEVSRGVAEVQADANRRGPMAGLRVLDLTDMLAGPYCTWMLGALGAEVTKVEMLRRGDFTRSIAPFSDDQSIYFMSVNRNKRSVTLNLKQASGRAALLRMVERADVFVENNRPGVMRRLGLDYQAISRINPENHLRVDFRVRPNRPL